jgi:hypothetical protein
MSCLQLRLVFGTSRFIGYHKGRPYFVVLRVSSRVRGSIFEQATATFFLQVISLFFYLAKCNRTSEFRSLLLNTFLIDNNRKKFRGTEFFKQSSFLDGKIFLVFILFVVFI